MLPEEIDRLAQAVNALRPDWAARDLKTFIANQLPNREYLEAAKAFAEVATDPTTRSPARILQPGPWWGDKPTAGGGTGGYGPVCRCGKTRPRHDEAESKVAPEMRHPFETDAEHEAQLRRENRGGAS